MLKYLHPFAIDNNGQDLILEACRGGHTDIVEYLVTKYRCPIAIKEGAQYSPLHCACEGGHVDLIQYLLQTLVPSILKIKTQTGETLFQLISNPNLIKKLLEQGATAKSADLDLMKFLLQQRMWDPMKNAGGYNALYLACMPSLTEVLLHHICFLTVQPGLIHEQNLLVESHHLNLHLILTSSSSLLSLALKLVATLFSDYS